MSTLAVSQLLTKGQDSGLNLTLDTDNLENDILLEAVEKMSLEAMPKSHRRGLETLVINFRIYS